jgi:ribosomal protein L40E
MPTKTVGYIKLEWTCPNCGTRNPGPEKTCRNCGSPQPENVQFERGADSTLITDEQEIKKAAAGPDIHCGFCGTRNPAGAETCSQCGADLREGARRQSGREIAPAAAAAQQVTCTNCGQANPATALNCANCGAPLPRVAMASAPAPAAATPPKAGSRKKWAIIGGVAALALCLCVAAVALLAIPSKTVSAAVQAVQWQTAVSVEAQQEVHYSDQTGSPPSAAYDVTSRTDNEEVCEDRTVDTGGGYAEVQQVCHDESTTYYSYTALEWQTVDTLTSQGEDLNPDWADPSLSAGQRRGEDQADYTVVFVGEGDTYTYSPDSLVEFQQYEIGSEWQLKLNALGGVVSVEP